LETESFAEMACHVRSLAEQVGAPIGVVLEGGYAPRALAASAIAALEAFAGEQQPHSAAPEALLTSRAAAQIGHYWPL
jgi:acetoin utilization deacetylase AcuC-like enzyme